MERPQPRSDRVVATPITPLLRLRRRPLGPRLGGADRCTVICWPLASRARTAAPNPRLAEGWRRPAEPSCVLASPDRNGVVPDRLRGDDAGIRTLGPPRRGFGSVGKRRRRSTSCPGTDGPRPVPATSGPMHSTATPTSLGTSTVDTCETVQYSPTTLRHSRSSSRRSGLGSSSFRPTTTSNAASPTRPPSR